MLNERSEVKLWTLEGVEGKEQRTRTRKVSVKVFELEDIWKENSPTGCGVEKTQLA